MNQTETRNQTEKQTGLNKRIIGDNKFQTILRQRISDSMNIKQSNSSTCQITMISSTCDVPKKIYCDDNQHLLVMNTKAYTFNNQHILVMTRAYTLNNQHILAMNTKAYTCVDQILTQITIS